MEPLWPLYLADRNNDADHGLKTHVMTFANVLQLWKGLVTRYRACAKLVCLLQLEL